IIAKAAEVRLVFRPPAIKKQLILADDRLSQILHLAFSRLPTELPGHFERHQMIPVGFQVNSVVAGLRQFASWFPIKQIDKRESSLAREIPQRRGVFQELSIMDGWVRQGRRHPIMPQRAEYHEADLLRRI